MNEKYILSIIDKFSAGSIGELDLSDGTYRLTLKKEHSGGVVPVAAGAPAGNPVETSAESSVRLAIAAGAENTASGEKINSPIVATFYASPSPDSPPFVKPGSKVKAGQTLCILEAMKMMNHLEAEFDCEIIEIHASSGELVEYGQELFTVKKQ